MAELREEVARLGYGEPIIQQVGAPNAVCDPHEAAGRCGRHPAIADEMTRKVTADIKSRHPDARIDGVDSVSGKVSGELNWTAFKALGFAALRGRGLHLVPLRMAVRRRRAVRAVPRRHADAGLFALTQLEFDLNIVAAILTLIGYSLNDTIVVYDRIRENLKKYRRMPMPELLDLSVNETLARTVMTSLSHADHAGRAAVARPARDLRLHAGDHARASSSAPTARSTWPRRS